MHKMKRSLAVILSAALTFSTLSFQPTAAAKNPKLNKKKITIEIKSTTKLTVKNAKKNAKVTWKTSKKKIAKITKKKSKGKKAYALIKGMKAGSAKITAIYKIGKKKRRLTCKVIVKAVHSDKTNIENDSKQDASTPDLNQGSNETTPKSSPSPTPNRAADESSKPTMTAKPTVTPTAAPTAKPTATATVKPTQTATVKPNQTPTPTPKPTQTAKPTATATTKPTATPTTKPTAIATTKPTATPTTKPTATPTTAPTPTPTQAATSAATPDDLATPTVKPTFAPSTQNYEYFNDYTLGYSGGTIVAYKNGKRVSLEEAGACVYNQKTDNVFGQQIADNNWYADKIALAQPFQYTTGDGTAHMVSSMLTNYSFMADPAAIDNTENDGKLYVYGTTEGFDYAEGKLVRNEYNNHSLTILSTKDMVNWTDEGTIDNQNLTNQPSSAAAKDKVKCKWGTRAWAPSGLKIDGDGDGEDEYYIFYTNGGAVGYVQGDSPTGPWKDDLGKVLFNQQTPNCEGVVWCFDPAVLVDDKGDAYVYFGGGPREEDYAHGKTARVCKITFEEGTGKVLLDGEPQEMDNYYMFEDSEINQFHGKYYYSYCTNFNVPVGDPWISSGQIAAYVSTDPMNIAFAPEGENGDQYTDENGIYHHYLGTILDNPSFIYGESYNNHHHMQSYKGHDYIFYHSTVLGNHLFRYNRQYRNLHVNEIHIDEDTDEISITPTYDGVSQIEDFEPYKNEDGTAKYINATTAALSAGVKSTRDDTMVLGSINGSPMVLDEIDTGDWSCIKGVNFGSAGLKNFGVEYMSNSDAGRIELFIDSPTELKNKVASLDILEETSGKYVFKNVSIETTVTGKHDVYFVFRGSGYKVASWAFSENATVETPDFSERPDVPVPTPVVPNPDIKTGWNADKTEYYLPLNEDCVKAEGGAIAEFDEVQGSVTLSYDGQYPGVWFQIPYDVKETFSSIEFTYKDATTSFGTAVRYSTSSGDEEINWGGKFPAGEGLLKQTFSLDAGKEFAKYKIFRNNAEDCYLTITSVVLKK